MMDYEYIYRHLGQCCLISDWTAGAEYGRKASEEARAFVAAEPENLWLRKKLLIDYQQLGTALFLLGDLVGAETSYRASLEVCRSNLAAEPGDVEKRRNVGVALGLLATLGRSRRDLDAARRLYGVCLSICEDVAGSDPGSPQKQGDVLEVYGAPTDVAERAERYGEALKWPPPTQSDERSVRPAPRATSVRVDRIRAPG